MLGRLQRLATGVVGMVGPYVGVVLLWWLVLRIVDVPAYLLPGPADVFKALWNGVVHGEYIDHAFVTLQEAFLGFGLAAALGLITAVVITEFRAVERAIYPLLVGLQSLPKIAVAPLILIWAGYGIGSKVITAVAVAFFPMLVNSIAGLRGYDPDMAELFVSLKASRWNFLRLLKLRAAIPSVVAGLKVAFVFAMLGAIVGEFVGGKAGLGYLLIQLQFELKTADVFAVLIVLSAIGILGERLIGMLGRRLTFWERVGE